LGTIWECKGKMGGGLVRDGDLAIGNIDETWFQINVKIQHMDDFFIKECRLVLLKNHYYPWIYSKFHILI
jgi:hypothetical protein